MLKVISGGLNHSDTGGGGGGGVRGGAWGGGGTRRAEFCFTYIVTCAGRLSFI